MIWDKKTNSLDYNGISRAMAQNKLDAITYYFEYIESHFEQDLNTINEEFRKLIKERNQIEHNNELDDLSAEYIETQIDELNYQSTSLNDNFIKNYRNSIVYQLFSFLELELKYFCNRYRNEFLFEIEDLKGSAIMDNFSLYLKRTKIRDIGNLNPEWEYIDNFRILRNCFIHQDGVIKSSVGKNFKKIQSFSKDNFTLKNIGKVKEYDTENRLIEIDDEIFYIILSNKEFIQKTIEKIESFLDKLYQSDRRHF